MAVELEHVDSDRALRIKEHNLLVNSLYAAYRVNCDAQDVVWTAYQALAGKTGKAWSDYIAENDKRDGDIGKGNENGTR
jgi:hypothetical protein